MSLTESNPERATESYLPGHALDGCRKSPPDAAPVATRKHSLTERALFWLVRRLYSTELAHSAEMKTALTDLVKFAEYRANEIQRVAAAADRYGLSFRGREVLDLGCSDGVLTHRYWECGAGRVIGVDVDRAAIARARVQAAGRRTEFAEFDGRALPLPDASVDVIVSYDVFEHVPAPPSLLRECGRVLRPGGRMLIGTWGWRHPFAPHLWAVMPVPWAHLVVSERSLLRVCRQVYESPWYVPTMFDVDKAGRKRPDRFLETSIPADYLNKYLIRDFEAAFRASGLRYRVYLEPFGARFARWSRWLVGMPWFRELFHGYMWAVLHKAPGPERPDVGR